MTMTQRNNDVQFVEDILENFRSIYASEPKSHLSQIVMFLLYLDSMAHYSVT